MANLDYFSQEDVISFTLLDENTVKRLQKEGDIKLPYKNLDKIKDERWNTKLMSSKLLQGILAGDSVPKIAKSLLEVVGNNEASAVRNARTMVTNAENRGRLDSYDDLAEQGVIQKKVWIATADDRTRESHLELDGEEVDIDQPFSNKLMYPADPSGDPAEVYNCRCSMRDHIVGFRRADGSISYVGAERDTTSHAGKIEDEIAQRGLERVAEVPAEAPAEPVVERPKVTSQIKGVGKSKTNDTRSEWLQDTLGYSEEEADDTLDAIRAYTMEGDVYSKIHNNDPAYASEIETLNNLIENPNMPVYDGEIYRGLHILDADGISAHDQIQLICESGTWTEGGITSFSSNMAKAKQFATGGATGHADEGLNVLIRIRSNQSGVPIQHLTGQRPEGEVLISSNVAQNGFNIVSYKFYEKDKELPWSGRVIHSRWCEIVVEE